MKKYFLISMIALISTLALLVACDSGSSSSSSNGETADPEDLTGTWYAVFEYSDGEEAEEIAVLFDITATNFRRIAYIETAEGMMQDEGAYGTYEVSGSDFVVSITEEWNDENYQWEEGPSERTTPYSFDGTTLTMEFPEIGEIQFTKTNFVQHANLADTTWFYVSDELTFHANGEYAYESDDYPSTGTWEATEDLLRYITTEENGEDIYYEILYDYVIEDNDLVLSWKGSNEFTLTPTLED